MHNTASDVIGGLGAASFSTSAFGFELFVNTSQSKPVLGSAASPQLDLTFTATTVDSSAHSAFFYVTDTDFVGPQSLQLSLGGTNSGGSGTVTGRSWGGTSNTALQFSGANLLNTVGPLSGPAYAGSASGTVTPTVTPYSLTIGVALNRTTPGTTTGDLNLASSPVSSTVPEPSSLLLGALGLMGVGITRRRR
jgi:PEP-CTERM motif